MTRKPDGDGAGATTATAEERPAAGPHGPDIDRRRFLGGVGGVTLGTLAGGVSGLAALSGIAGGPSAAEATEIAPLPWNQRRDEAEKFRKDAAKAEFQMPVPHELECNGDEDLYPNRIASYHKSLPHDSVTGEVDTAAYDAMLATLAAGDFTAFNAVPTPGSLKQLSPLAGLTYGLAGPDTRVVVAPPFPTLASRELAAEAAELYWMALLRDIPFHD